MPTRVPASAHLVLARPWMLRPAPQAGAAEVNADRERVTTADMRLERSPRSTDQRFGGSFRPRRMHSVAVAGEEARGEHGHGVWIRGWRHRSWRPSATCTDPRYAERPILSRAARRPSLRRGPRADTDASRTGDSWPSRGCWRGLRVDGVRLGCWRRSGVRRCGWRRFRLRRDSPAPRARAATPLGAWLPGGPARVLTAS